MLRQRCVSDLVLFPHSPKKTRKEYIKDLEDGETVEVEGFPWTRTLWQNATKYSLDVNELESKAADGNICHIGLDKTAGSLYLNRLLPIPNPMAKARLTELNPDLSRLFNSSLKQINHFIPKN
jgi:hypothetical protein